MTARVAWLPVGHIAHGYRRVFAIFEDETLRHIVSLVPMPYEQVYHVLEMAGPNGVEDPSLWWGLSVIVSLVEDGTLLAEENPDTADDGYLQVRPRLPDRSTLIALDTYRSILASGSLVFDSNSPAFPMNKEDVHIGSD